MGNEFFYITNGFGEILTFILSISVDLFNLLDPYGDALVDYCFGDITDIPSKVRECIINISIYLAQ